MTSLFIRACLFTAVLSVPVLDARAAFEFIPPVQSPAAAAPAEQRPSGMTMSPAPAANVVSEALSSAGARTSPQSILPPAPALPQYTLAPAAPAPTASGGMPAINMNPLGAAGQQPAAPARVEQAMMQAAVPAAYTPASLNAGPRHSAMSAPVPQGGFDEAMGFGRDLPLALAVSQIVPPDYAFSFEQSVNPGDSISWEGGKPWDQVLNDALSAVGASARIDPAKKEVTVISGSAGGIMPAAYVAPPQQQAPRPPVPHAAPASASSAMVPMPAQTVAPLDAVPPVMQGAAPGPIRAILDPKAVSLWQAERGATLRAILEDWSMRAGVELFWSSDFDFPVSSSVRINGTFEEAVQTLLNGLRDAQPRPIGRLHPNLPDGPSVLIVETRHILQ